MELVVLETEPSIAVPLLLLRPGGRPTTRTPAVVGIAQHGKQDFLQQRADQIAGLLAGGVAVCLPDLRGTGETTPAGDRRGPPAGSYKGVAANSAGTMLASQELMLGRTLLGDRLSDLRSVCRWLRGRPDVDARRIALWGESFADANPDDRRFEVPWDADDAPARSEPLGGLLALLGGLFEEDVAAVAVRGGLVGYASLLEGRFCYAPHDVIVPGVLTAGDVADIAAALVPRPLRVEGMVDELNRLASGDLVEKSFEPARQAYRSAGAGSNLRLEEKDGRGARTAAWLIEQLGSRP